MYAIRWGSKSTKASSDVAAERVIVTEIYSGKTGLFKIQLKTIQFCRHVVIIIKQKKIH